MAEQKEQKDGSGGASVPILEVPFSPSNVNRFGSPIERREQIAVRYLFYPTWRSQLVPLLGFFLTGILCVLISDSYPALVIRGKLFDIGATRYYLHLPILVLVPGFLLGKVLMKMFDARYIVDARGVEAQIGLVSLKLRQPRLRFEDIRGVEPEQTIWQRILNIGDVAIGSAMTDGVEILMQGVGDPRAVQLLVSSEMEKRLRSITSGGGGSAGGYVAAVRGD